MAVVGEPVGRNTAPAIGAAAAWFQARGGGAFAVLPSDHLIDDVDAFVADADRAFAAAERDRALLTFGIPATGPETNFGYIQRGASRSGRGCTAWRRFTEKPDRARAESWVAGGRHLWNSGMFVWRPDVFLEALEREPARAGGSAARPGGRRRRPAQLRAGARRRVPRARVHLGGLRGARARARARSCWRPPSTGTTWARGARGRAASRATRSGNVLFGDAVAVDCDGCIVVGEGGTAAALGLQDMVVVHVDGSTLACRLEETDRVRRVSEAVRQRGTK